MVYKNLQLKCYLIFLLHQVICADKTQWTKTINTGTIKHIHFHPCHTAFRVCCLSPS